MDIKKTTYKFVQKLRDTYLPGLTYYKDFQVEFGRNYAKIISLASSSRSVWGYIVIQIRLVEIS